MMSNFTNELVNFIFIGLPECITLTVICLLLLRFELKWPKILLISTTLALVVLVFRSLLLDTSIHTSIAIITLALLISYFYKSAKLPCMITSLISMLMLTLSETPLFCIYNIIFSVDIKDLAQNRLLWILSAWLKCLLYMLIGLTISRINWYRIKKFYLNYSTFAQPK